LGFWKLKINFLVFISLGLFGFHSVAETAGANQIQGRAEALWTSSEYRSSGISLGYGSNISDSQLHFDFLAKEIQGKVATSDFSFKTLTLNFENKKNDLRTYGALSTSQRTITGRPDSSSAFGLIGAEWTETNLFLGLETGARDFSQEFQSLTSVRENLKGPYTLVRITYKFAEKWQLRGMNKNYFISDDNQRADSDLALMYGVSPGWPWIWVGLGGELMTNSKANTTGYWAPRQFTNYGPRLDVAAPIADKTTFYLGLNVNKFNDIDFGDGTGFYGVSKLVYGADDSWKIELGVESISSDQNASRWTSTMAFLGVSCLF